MDDTIADDREYMAAVECGDMETAQRMVDEAAERAFADSIIRTKDNQQIFRLQRDPLGMFSPI